MTDEATHTQRSDLDERTEALLPGWKNGDPNAREELCRLYRGWITGAVKRRVGSRLARKEQLDDFVQEVFFELERKREGFQIIDAPSFRSFLTTVIVYHISDRAKYYGAGVRDYDCEKSVGGVLPSNRVLRHKSITRPDARAARNDEAEYVRRIVETRLDAQQRELVHLHNDLELSFEEIGKLQGVRKDTVRMRWTRLIEKIAQIVKSDE